MRCVSKNGLLNLGLRSSYRKPLRSGKAFAAVTPILLPGRADQGSIARGAEPEVVRLWDDAAPGAALGSEPKDVPQLLVYRVTTPAAPANGRTAVLVCPGGGYGGLAMGH